MAADDKKPLPRALGSFFGHIWKGLTGPTDQPTQKREIRREVDEEVRDTPRGRVTVRRTTIEEIEVEPTDGGPDRPAR